MARKKILFATQRDYYPFFVGGAEISAHTLLSYLVSRGHQCLALGILGKNLNNLETYAEQFEQQGILYQFKSKAIKVGSYQIPNDLYLSLNVEYDIKLTLLNNFAKFFLEHASKFKPDLLITQMMGSGLAVRFGYENMIPCVHLIRDINTLYNLEPLFLEPKYEGYADLFSNSKFIQKEFKERYKKNSKILYPTINVKNYKLDARKDKYITFINPVSKKGIGIFVKIANELPKYIFLVVEGWEKISKDSPLRKLKNVVIKSRQFDMKHIYKETKLLLIPSVWEEAFARVVIEAQAAGIPIIASAHSGLIESVGKGGILVKDYLNYQDWVVTIKKIYSSKDMRESFSRMARKNAEKFDVTKTTSEFCKIYGL